MKKMSIVSLGDLMIERFLSVGEHFIPNSTIIFDSEYDEKLGGPAFNIAWYLRQWGWRPLCMGVFGNKDTNIINDSFNKASLDTSGIITKEGHTDRLISFFTKNEHLSVYLRSKVDSYNTRKLEALCGIPDVLILSGSRHKPIQSLFVKLTEKYSGVQIFFNPSYSIFEFNKDNLLKVVKNAHMSFFNEQEFNFCLKSFMFKNAREFKNINDGIFVVTKGQEGAKIYTKSGHIEINSFSKNTINPIGGGDSFISGYIHSTLNNNAIEYSANFAAAVAAFVVESKDIRIQITENVVLDRITEANCNSASKIKTKS